MMKNPEEIIAALLKGVQDTRDQELDCDQVFEAIDVYAEAALRGEAPQDMLPMVKHHLEMCKDCYEEYEALLEVLQHLDA
jgi:hypothetical protein